jgi:hypothetical protein
MFIATISLHAAMLCVQARGTPCGIGAGLDLVNFERRQARLVFGANF